MGIKRFILLIITFLFLIQPCFAIKIGLQTDVNKTYMENGKLQVIPLGKGYAWFDTGSADRLADASDYVKAIELRQGVQIACLEEIAYLNGWISKDVLSGLAELYKKNQYGQYLLHVIEEVEHARLALNE